MQEQNLSKDERESIVPFDDKRSIRRIVFDPDRLSVSAVERAALPHPGVREKVAGDLGLLENAHDVCVEMDSTRQFEDVRCTFQDGHRQARGAGQIAGHSPDRPAADDDQVLHLNRAIRE